MKLSSTDIYNYQTQKRPSVRSELPERQQSWHHIMSPPGLVITLLLSVLLQTNPALMDLVNILSKLPPVTIEPFKQEGKHIYITFYIEFKEIRGV